MVGAQDWSRAIACTLMSEGIKVILVDTNSRNITRAHNQGLCAYQCNMLSERVTEMLDFNDIGYLVTLTSNHEANSLIILHLLKEFGRAHVYQIRPRDESSEKIETMTKHLQGRQLFSEGMDSMFFDRAMLQGWMVESIKLQTESDVLRVSTAVGITMWPLFIINEKKEVDIVSDGIPFLPKQGCAVVCLLKTEK